MASDLMTWRYPQPFTCLWAVSTEQIDHYRHANNVAYVRQLETTAWAHSRQLGLDIQQYQNLDRGMAISRHEINYLAAAYAHDEIECATWIVECDNKLKLAREFQFIRRSDQRTILTARTEFVCIALSTGKPKRMPKIFADTYHQALIAKQKHAL